MIINYPLLSEKAIGIIEKQNMIVFIVNSTSTKNQIKKEVERLYQVKVERVNTLNSIKGGKKAYIKLAPKFKAVDLATKLRIM